MRQFSVTSVTLHGQKEAVTIYANYLLLILLIIYGNKKLSLDRPITFLWHHGPYMAARKLSLKGPIVEHVAIVGQWAHKHPHPLVYLELSVGVLALSVTAPWDPNMAELIPTVNLLPLPEYMHYRNDCMHWLEQVTAGGETHALIV